MKRSFVLIITTLCFGLSTFAQEGSPTRPAGEPVPVTDSTESTSSRIPVKTSKYVTGGVIGSAIGLGIGHGIQGRYADKGWIFTATEAAGIAMMVAGCNDRKDTDNDGDEECNNQGLAGAGLILAIGFHVWEIVDVWTGATPVDEAQPVAFLLPDPKAPSVGIAWRF